MNTIFKSICLIPALLFCINCGVADSTEDTNPTLTVPHDGGVSGEGGAGGEAGNSSVGGQNVGGFAGALSTGGQSSTGGFAGTSNIGGHGGRCNHHHRAYCDPDTHKCQSDR